MRRILAMILCLSLLAFPVRGAEDEKYVALTFDDGPSGRFTRRLLDGLAERDARASAATALRNIPRKPSGSLTRVTKSLCTAIPMTA